MSNPAPYQYNFEIETILRQFIKLIDGAICIRYDTVQDSDERIFRETVEPLYIVGPKHRIIHHLVNQAKTFSYPYVACRITGIEGNADRIAAKHLPIKQYNGKSLIGYDRPTPITLSIETSIVTDKITDLYQIYGKLATQFQPYRAYSWYVPHRNLDKTDWQELTGKVEWDFNASFDIKEQLNESDVEEYKATMSFKITGWLFPNKMTCMSGIIYDIGTSDIISAELANRIHGLEIDSYQPLVSGARKAGEIDKYDNPREWNNAHPRIVNVFQTIKVGNKSINQLLDNARVFPFTLTEDRYIVLDGYNFEHAEVLFVPKDFSGIVTNRPKKSFDYGKATLFPLRGKIEGKHSIIEGYSMNVIERSRNKLTVNFKDIEYHGNFDIVVADTVDWDSAEDRLRIAFTAK